MPIELKKSWYPSVKNVLQKKYRNTRKELIIRNKTRKKPIDLVRINNSMAAIDSMEITYCVSIPTRRLEKNTIAAEREKMAKKITQEGSEE